MPRREARTYTQCRLELALEAGVLKDMVWIPTQFAVVGKHLSILAEDGSWRPWRVKARGSTQDARYVEGHERDHARMSTYDRGLDI